MTATQHLPLISALSDFVTIVKKDDVKMIKIAHPKAEAMISLFGAHVTSFKPTGQKDLLWMSEKGLYDGKTPLRGGIPVCWPWFARAAQPNHGFARTSEWELVEHRENEDGVIVRLGLIQNEETLAIWPHKFELFIDVEVSDELNTTLHIKNTDDKAWKFSSALHTYFNIADINQTEITGMGASFIDKLQAGKVCTGGDALTFTAGVDRVYTDPSQEVCIRDPQNERTISVINGGNDAAVIWNPWELAAGMDDMDADGYLTMVCVESTLYADSLETGKQLEPNETHQISTRLSLK
ncbi:MAG: D-hexose-6-phosphate mutarotase [Vibrio sp.]